MREILFRGREKGGAKWFEGDLSFLVHDKIKCYIFPPDGYDSPDRYEVDPETVGQYTGLDDKNGRKIFEGDLVKLDGWTPPAMQIAFIEGAFCLADADEVGEYCGDIHYIHHAGDNQTTVIGNIHDNPELLRGR